MIFLNNHALFLNTFGIKNALDSNDIYLAWKEDFQKNEKSNISLDRGNQVDPQLINNIFTDYIEDIDISRNHITPYSCGGANLKVLYILLLSFLWNME